MAEEYSVRTILELACAAQRINEGYVKELIQFNLDEDSQTESPKFANKALISYTLGIDMHIWNQYPLDQRPPFIRVTDEDRTLADTIQHYFRRLIFSAIADDNTFESNVNTILNSDTITVNNFGFIACLPSVYRRNLAQGKVNKASRTCDNSYLGEPGDILEDLDCEILEIFKSKNFDAFNVTAIIDNKMVSWMSSKEFTEGPCVLVRAKIKEKSTHYRNNNPVTRLNYVKVEQ